LEGEEDSFIPATASGPAPHRKHVVPAIVHDVLAIPVLVFDARAPTPAREKVRVSLQILFLFIIMPAHQHEIQFAFPPNPVLVLHAGAPVPAQDTIHVPLQINSFSSC